LLLLVSPRLDGVDDDQIRQAFLEELSRGSGPHRQGVRMWQRAGTVEVKREYPVATKAGKILPFHLAQQSPAQMRSSSLVGSALDSRAT
jgi:hypothetical protein